MKKQILAMTALAAATLATAASAADLPRNNYYSQPAPGSYYNWAGWYAGAIVGYEWGKVPGTSTKPSGILGGLTGGYNWQSGQFVLGGETDLQISGADDTFAPYKFSNPWFGTLRGRAGMAWNNVLVYITGGIAYGGLKGESGALSETKTHIGWTLGPHPEPVEGRRHRASYFDKLSMRLKFLWSDFCRLTAWRGRSPSKVRGCADRPAPVAGRGPRSGSPAAPCRSCRC